MLMQTTNEYKKFKTLEGNRELDRPHLKRLAEALSLRPELIEAVPILVNERFEVIDGQHRLEVLKELKKPVPYIQMEGLDLKDVQTLNSTQRNWGPIDFARSYARQGNRHYQTYLQLKEQFPYGHTILMTYCGGVKSGKELIKFRAGRFEIPDPEMTDTWLNYLDDIREVVPHMARRPVFAGALLRAFRSPSYDHNRMLRKLAIASHLVQVRDGQADYLRDLEQVYNFKNQGVPDRLF